LTLTPAQRLAFFEAIPTILDTDEVLVFEDDGGGWHHAITIDHWIAWSVVDEGTPYSFNVGDLLETAWNPVTLQYDDEVGKLNTGNISLYVCSIDKKKAQAYASELAQLIGFTRLGLSLDFEGLTTGPQDITVRPLKSYNDMRLKRRVYRTLIEIPIIYKFSRMDIVPPIKRIGVEGVIYPGHAEMGEIIMHANIPLSADIELAYTLQSGLSASIYLEESV
jgi:hypothetical protein